MDKQMDRRIGLHILRGIFILLAAGCGGLMAFSFQDANVPSYIIGGVAFGAVFVLLELSIQNVDLRTMSSVIFGLIAGVVLATLSVGFIQLIYNFKEVDLPVLRFTGLAFMLVFSYLFIAVILRTRDDFKFIIPYVEFSKELKGPLPWLVDTSAIIDGRLYDLCGTGIVEAPLVVPGFVVEELHALADSADGNKRMRGRRGLDLLAAFQKDTEIELKIMEGVIAAGVGVDEKIINLAGDLGGKIVTTDFNLNKVAGLRNIAVINLNEIAKSLKPQFTAGDCIRVKINKEGEEADQGVGYLEDGTMVVVEGARPHVGEDIPVEVTSSYQSSAGRMIFGKFQPVDDS